MKSVPSHVSRRSVLLGGLGAAGALALSACAPGATAPRTGPVTLTNVEHDSRPLDNAAYQAVYEAFRTKHPDITIDFTTIPWEQARSKLLTLGQGNGLPHMGRIAFAADFAAAEMVLPLDDRVTQDSLARFDEDALDLYRAPGSDGEVHLYALPWFAGAHAVMVNKTLFDQAGIALPTDWTTDQFTELAAAITDAAAQRWGVAIDGNGIGDPVEIFLVSVYGFGGKWVAGDPESTEPEPIVFDSPETVAGIEWYVDLYKKGYAVPSAPSDTYQQRDANFLAGKAAMAWQGPWNIQATRDTFAKSGHEVISMPLPSGPEGVVGIYGGGGAGMFVSAERDGVLDQAYTWIDFLTSDEGQRIYCGTNGMIPASRPLRDEMWAHDTLYAGYLKTLESTPTRYPNWASGIEGVNDVVIPPLLQSTLAGQITPQEMATQVQAQVVEGLKNNGIDVPAA